MNVLVSLYIRTPYGLVQHCKFLCYWLHLQSSFSQLSSSSAHYKFRNASRVYMNSPETGRGTSDVLRAVFLRIGVFWYLTLCLWVCGSRRFVDIRYQSKRRGPLTERHVISQKTQLNSFVTHCCAPCS